MRQIDHFLATPAGSATRQGDVFDPNNGEVQAKVALGTRADLDRAVAAAKPPRRARVMSAFKARVEKNIDALAHLLSSEHGKVIADAKGDVQRGLEVVEFASGVPHVLQGEFTEG